MKKREACLHMEVFDNLHVPKPSEHSDYENRYSLEIIEILLDALEDFLGI